MGAGDEGFLIVDPDSFPSSLYTTLGPGLVQLGPLHQETITEGGRGEGGGDFVVKSKSLILNKIISDMNI